SASAASIEVRRGRTPPRELEVHVHTVALDVPKQPAVAVDPVERRICLEHNLLPRRREGEEGSPSCPRVALPGAELRRVDLEQPDPPSIPKRQCVAVVDRGHYGNL